VHQKEEKMARRLEGKTFFTNRNNGVTAITSQDYSEETAQLVEQLCVYYDAQGFTAQEQKDAKNAVISVVFFKPVFTFARAERVMNSPWFTGGVMLAQTLKYYIKQEGGIIQEADFYVPFSNGYELGIHGVKALQDELRWITTKMEFEQEFGVSLTSLLKETHKSIPIEGMCE